MYVYVRYVRIHDESAHSRIARGNLVLRHSVPHFPPNSGDIACSPRHQSGEMEIQIKLIFHFLEWLSNPLVGFTVTLCAPAPRLAQHNVIF